MQGHGQQYPPAPSSPGMYPAHHPPYPPQQLQQQQQHPGYGSQPSLPRYTSQASSVGGGYAGSPGLAPSPLNPSVHRQGSHPNMHMSANAASSGLNSRFSTYGYGNGGPAAAGGAHPLSNALYADNTPSSPTLAGDESEMDEKKGLASFPPSSSSSSGDSSSNNNARRRNNAASSAVGGAYRRMSGAFIADSGRDQRHTKPSRIGYLDGLRFIAACIALNGTFFNATITSPNAYSAIQRSSPLYIFRSFGLALSFFLIILGRALSAPLWDVPQSRTSTADLNKYGSSAAPSISFPRLTRVMLTRPFRFLLPVLVIAAVQWALGATNATKDCNSAGMTQPYWNQIRNFAGYCTVVFDCFSAFEYQTVMAQAFAGNLWTNAWFFQSSYAVYICHMMLGNLSTSRFWVYGVLGFLMWTTNNFFCLAIIGLTISDMAAHGAFARVRKWPFMRTLAIQLILLALGLCLQFINPVRDGLNKGMGTINVTGHTELSFADLILATCIILIFETSGILQKIFGNIVMRSLGRLAPGIYLLAPAITYTVVPTLAVSLHNSGTAGEGILGVTWVVCFAICVVCAIPFHFIIELPSKLAGEYFADFMEKWGATPDDLQVKGPQKSAPKKISGPGK